MRQILLGLTIFLPLSAQTSLPAGQNVPFLFAGRNVPQLLNGANGFRFTLPENTVYAAVRLQTFTPGVNIQLLVRSGEDITGTASDPAFGWRDDSDRWDKQVLIGLTNALLIDASRTYFVALRAAESTAPVAGILRLELRAMTPGGTRVEFSGSQEILLAGQPDGTQHNDFVAPLNSPPEPIVVSAGQGMMFEAAGISTQGWNGQPAGVEGEWRDNEGGRAGSAFGLSDIDTYPGEVVGVFVGPSINRRLEGQILPLDFTSEIRERTVVRPALQQMFAIGSGFTAAGIQRAYLVPSGATRLYLGRARTVANGIGRTVVRVSSIASVPGDAAANPLRLGAATFIQLAGQPDGARAGSNGHAPMHSPPRIALNIVPGQTLVFRASGSARNGYNGTINGPAGDPRVSGVLVGGVGYGISGYSARPGAVVGVFLGNTSGLDNPPPTLDFAGPLGNATTLRPLVNQVFLIGDGKVADGSDRKVVVPAGAARLYVSQARSNESQTGSFTVAVSAEIAARPTYAKDDIVNAASFGGGPVSPGSIVKIFGANLGARAVASAVPLPRALGGTQVFFDTILAPLYTVSPGEISAQVPWELGAAQSAILTIVRDGIPGPPVEIDLAPYRPALFTTPGNGAILFNSRTGSLVTQQDPARPGDVLTGYATGLGATSGDPRTGEPGEGPPSANAALPTRLLFTGPGGEREAAPLFTALAPGFVGVFQIRFSLPAGLGSGTGRLQIDSVPFGASPEVEFALSR